jgi:hypothetical protein
MKEIEAVSANVDKITVKNEQGKVRSFKKVLYFSDFMRRLESYYPGTKFMLTRADSNEVVGSQDEFYFAFKGVAQGEKTLELDMTISRKRKIDTGFEKGLDENDLKCKICMDRKMDSFFPCQNAEQYGHGACTYCFNKISSARNPKCPWCRKSFYVDDDYLH